MFILSVFYKMSDNSVYMYNVLITLKECINGLGFTKSSMRHIKCYINHPHYLYSMFFISYAKLNEK